MFLLFLCSQGVDILNNWLRIECNLTETPIPSPSSSTFDLTTMVGITLTLHYIGTMGILILPPESSIVASGGSVSALHLVVVS